MEFYAASLVKLARKLGGTVTVTSVKRGAASQRRLYERWKAGLSKYPAAKPGTSTHEKGLAFDLHVEPRELLTTLGKAWKNAGLTWGGDFRDPIHFDFRQRPPS